MKKLTKKRYFILLMLYALIIFVFNSQHIIQQGTYYKIFVPIAENLFDNVVYSCSTLGNISLFYPMWGYTFLQLPDVMLGTQPFVILIIQFILTILSISAFYDIFNIEWKKSHILLFTPFIAIMSTKTPDAIVASMIVFLIYFIKKYYDCKQFKYLIFSGIISGIILNFRSEYLYVLPFVLIFVLIKHRKISFQVFKIILVNFCISIIILLPWTIRSYIENDDFRLTASNGGAVMYLSLGQLPTNDWNISPYDITVYDIADTVGFVNPYTPKADSYFKNKVIEAITDRPFEYIKKVSFNFLNSILRGVYTGEYANFLVDKHVKYKFDMKLSMTKGISKKIDFIFEQDVNFLILYFLEKLLQLVFVLVFLNLILIFIKMLFKNNLFKNPIMIFIFSFIIYKFIIVSLIQYEYRHMNAIYLLILGLYLKNNLLTIFSKVRHQY